MRRWTLREPLDSFPQAQCPPGLRPGDAIARRELSVAIRTADGLFVSSPVGINRCFRSFSRHDWLENGLLAERARRPGDRRRGGNALVPVPTAPPWPPGCPYCSPLPWQGLLGLPLATPGLSSEGMLAHTSGICGTISVWRTAPPCAQARAQPQGARNKWPCLLGCRHARRRQLSTVCGAAAAETKQTCLEDIRAVRLGKVDEIRSEGGEPFAYRFDRTHTVADLREIFRSALRFVCET